MAVTLNRILQSTVVTNSKQYIAELASNSHTLQKLNEQFRHIAPKLDIVSFYETRTTPIGFKNTKLVRLASVHFAATTYLSYQMVLEKDSSVLGYPGEISKALDADHNGICKYDSPGDPNYVAVRNILKSLVSKIISNRESGRQVVDTRRLSNDARAVLCVSELPIVDYSFFRDQWSQDTNNWILENELYSNWRHTDPSRSNLLWLCGGPASGKSVMASFIINRLAEEGQSCQYFFVRHGDRNKRNLSTLLRSIAYQSALTMPDFMSRIGDLASEAEQFEAADSRLVWERVFRLALLRLTNRQPVFWVIDGLDEADSPKELMRLLPDLGTSTLPIRILLVSRRTPDIEGLYRKLPSFLDPQFLALEGRNDDFESFVTKELTIPGAASTKTEVTKRILAGAQNNFLVSHS